MTVSLWHIASGLGVGAFIASLFFGIVKHFGRAKGRGFETSQLGKEATAIIAVLIILISGGVTVVALVLYAPHPGASSAPSSVVPAKTSAFAPPTESPVPVARAWLTVVDDGDYDGSWDKSSVRLQNSMDKFNWRKVLTEIRHP